MQISGSGGAPITGYRLLSNQANLNYSKDFRRAAKNAKTQKRKKNFRKQALPQFDLN
jgi:hypothetical protein